MDLPILKPLSDATAKTLQPLYLGDRDYLVIGTAREARAFSLRAVSAHPAIGDEVPDALSITASNDTVVRDGGYPTFTARTEFFRRLPESKSIGARDWKNPDLWESGATDYTAVVIHHSWPRERLIFLDDEAKNLYEFLLLRFLGQNGRAVLQARYKIDGVTPVMPSDYKPNKTFPPAEYQKAALAFSLGQESTALFMDRGTGKTYISIDRICTESRRARAGKSGDPHMLRVLIIVPKQVRLNWLTEFQRFSTAPGKVTILKGQKLKRLKLLSNVISSSKDCAFSVAITSYDVATNDCDTLSMIPWDGIILDESHRIKSTHTKRWSRIKKLRDSAKWRMELTGTAYGNSIMDYYSQLEFLGRGLSGFSTIKEFRKFHVNLEKRGDRLEAVGFKNIPLMQERLARLSFAITKEEAGLQLPEKVRDIYEVEMTKRQTEFYDAMCAQLVLELKEAMDFSLNKTMTAENILTRLLRLAQITSGHVKWDARFDDDGTVLSEARVEQIDEVNPKIEAVVDMVNEARPREKIVVWCYWREDIERIEERLVAEGVNCGSYYGATTSKRREEVIHLFNNDPEFKVIVASPGAAGEGLNLLGYNPTSAEYQTVIQWIPRGRGGGFTGEERTTPVNAMYVAREIFFSVNWSRIQREQAEDRAHRRGTFMPVQITDLVVPSTIDEEMRSRVYEKTRTANTIENIQHVLEAVLGLKIDGGWNIG